MNHKVIITGGLGNQMFQYAYVLALRQRGLRVAMDTSYYDFFKMHNGYELENVFGIKEFLINKQGFHMYWLRVLNKYRPSCLYTYDKLLFEKNALEFPRHYIFGYWQDERYFSGVEEQVRRLFEFHGIDENNKRIADEMKGENSVSLHIRRGDYAQFGMSLVGEDYYRKAIDRIKSQVEAPIFYIFSDDMREAENMAKSMNLSYKLMCHNREENSYKDMFLMSQCKHNIIANSSFSWWGAWLNSNPKKMVIAPERWDGKTPDFKPQAKGWILD